ncbi:hypothetical protein C8J57DRAFT_1379867 [Mycena rebaudengoi]|nr:hypothetical protein C8J57DRAFT_1379867 [Mycena rebaudengoi]
MQFISSLTIALLTLVMSASASPAERVTLTPNSVAAAGLTNVHDFQGNSLNLVEASQTNGTAVILFPSGFNGSIKQQERTQLIYVNIGFLSLNCSGILLPTDPTSSLRTA